MDKDERIRQVVQDYTLNENLDQYADQLWSLDKDSGLLLWDGLVYIPDKNSLKLRIMHQCHDDGPSGHLGQDKTLEKVSRHFHFPGARNFVRNYISTCDQCHRAKSLRLKKHGFLQPLTIATQPWESISMDFIVKFPTSPEGNDSVFVIVDRFTKFAYFIPFKEEGYNASRIAQLFFQYIFANHGLPKSIVSDRGSVFTSDFWQCLMALLHVKTDLSTSFHPQTDGQTERVNQTLEQYLRIYINYEQDSWEKLLPLAQYCYNNAAHASTNITPFFANFGYHPTLDISIPSLPLRRPNKPAQDYVAHLRALHENLKESLTIVAQRMKASYDANVRAAPDFHIGDKVWLNAKNIRTLRPNKKLDHRYLGPFIISAQINDSAFRLDLPPEMEIHPTFHVSLLHPYNTNKLPNRIQPIPPITMVNGHEEQEVESIQDSRTYHGKLQYRVKWRGQNDTFTSWEPASNLENSQDLVEIFHSSHPRAAKTDAARQSSRNKRGANHP
jgi:hypothetical protein